MNARLLLIVIAVLATAAPADARAACVSPSKCKVTVRATNTMVERELFARVPNRVVMTRLRIGGQQTLFCETINRDAYRCYHLGVVVYVRNKTGERGVLRVYGTTGRTVQVTLRYWAAETI